MFAYICLLVCVYLSTFVILTGITMSAFFINMLLIFCICNIKYRHFFVWHCPISLQYKKARGVVDCSGQKGEGEKRKELQEEERDLHHSSAVQQCMNRAGYSIILTLPLIYLIIFLSMHIIMVAVACVMNSLFD